MQKILSVSAVLLSLTATAQTPSIPSFYGKHSTAKTTGSSERLIARTISDYYAGTGYQFTDSATMSWDWTNFSKTEFLPAPLVSFDRATELYSYSNSAGTPTPVQKSLNFFDGAGRIYANYRFRWNASTSTWDSSARTLTNWSGTQISDSTYEMYLGSRGWIGRKKSSFTYSGGNLESITNEVSSGVTTVWNNDTRYWYFWTGTNLTQTQSERWESASSSWIKQYKNDISYTGSDSTLSITQRWNTSSSSWVNTIRRCYKISAVGPYADDSTYNWNAVTSSWTPSTKNAVIYSGPDISQYIQYVWDASLGNWAAYNVYYYLHSTAAQLTEAGAYRWNSTTSAWEIYFYYQYLYNAAGSLTTELPFVLNASGGFDPGGNRRNYYYERFSGIKETNAAHSTASLFPNPATGSEHVALRFSTQIPQHYKLTIRDIQGRTLYQSQGTTSSNQQATLSVAGWHSGMYLVSLAYGDGTTETLKLTL